VPNPPRTPVATLFAGGGASPTALAAALGVAALEYGSRRLDEHAGLPRCILVPGAGSFEGAPQRTPGTQRAVATAWSGWTAHLWGADLDAAREMERALAAWLVDNWPAAHRLLGDDAPPDAALQDGAALVVRFALKETLVAAPRTTVVVTTTAIDSSTAAASDGALTAGET